MKPVNHGPEGAETSRPWELLTDESIDGLVNWYLDESRSQSTTSSPYLIERDARSSLKSHIMTSIRGLYHDQNDTDYFTLLQVSLRQNRKSPGYPSFYEDGVRRNIPSMIYEGVNNRIQRDPEFAERFLEFAGDLYDFYGYESRRSGKWGRMIEDSLRLAHTNRMKLDGEDTGNVSYWLKAVGIIHKKANSGQLYRESVIEQVERHRENAYTSRREYVFSPVIASKDTRTLQHISDDLEDEPANLYFGFGRRQDKVMRWAFDLFRHVLQEAGDGGWPNARQLFEAWQETPMRDMPEFSPIIHLSNLVVTPINRAGGYSPDNVRLKQLDPTKIENVQEALDRCTYVIFSLGQQPDSNPAIFLLSADIVAKTFASAAALRDRDSGAEPDEPGEYSAYREQLRANKRTYWSRRRSGYGLIS